MTDFDPDAHEFVAYARRCAPIGSLREVFFNYLYGNREALPRDNRECEAVVRAAMAAYTEQKKAEEARRGCDG